MHKNSLFPFVKGGVSKRNDKLILLQSKFSVLSAYRYIEWYACSIFKTFITSSSEQVPCAIRRVDEHGFEPGVNPVQPLDQCDPAQSPGHQESHQGGDCHVLRTRGCVWQHDGGQGKEGIGGCSQSVKSFDRTYTVFLQGLQVCMLLFMSYSIYFMSHSIRRFQQCGKPSPTHPWNL